MIESEVRLSQLEEHLMQTDRKRHSYIIRKTDKPKIKINNVERKRKSPDDVLKKMKPKVMDCKPSRFKSHELTRVMSTGQPRNRVN